MKVVPIRTWKGIAGTGLDGYLALDRAAVEAVLGKPSLGPSEDGKMTHEWAFSVDGRLVVTIYDYKGDGEYHVGSNGAQLARLVIDALFGDGAFRPRKQS